MITIVAITIDGPIPQNGAKYNLAAPSGARYLPVSRQIPLPAAGPWHSSKNDRRNGVYLSRYDGELKDPAVTVLVRTLTEPRVYLAGDIAKPGFITVRNKIGVLQAIDEAGGFLETANINDVTVIRKGPNNQPFR